MPPHPPLHQQDAKRSPGDASQPQGPSLPHDRDQQNSSVNPNPDPHIERAAQDLKQGQVDTDLRQTPGLDADHRGTLVDGGEHGAGHKPATPRQ